MAESADWREKTYEHTLEEELLGLERRLEADPDCGAGSLEGILAHLYRSEGADWGGRGEVQNIILSATIAAYELTIARLRKAGGPESVSPESVPAANGRTTSK
ncbi:MAG: hypothetical protein LBK40_03605 [Spirochaetaceae bacterium]|jgi:hypothetical protein|nr:hypothetical protein [Spirochaetaceae bacterium]